MATFLLLGRLLGRLKFLVSLVDRSFMVFLDDRLSFLGNLPHDLSWTLLSFWLNKLSSD
jgi:hypothetical protein